MRKILLVWATLAGLLSAGPVLAASDTAQDPAAHYQALLADAKAGKEPIDWQALRFAYADSPGFDVMGPPVALRKQMFDALKADDFADALAQAKLVIDQDYVNIDAHQVASVADGKLGDPDGAAREHEIVVGLLRSIQTGDGLSEDAAFTVIEVEEEYSLMNASGMKVTAQTLIHDGPHSYDKLDVIDRDGAAHSFYFQIDRVSAAETAMFKPKP